MMPAIAKKVLCLSMLPVIDIQKSFCISSLFIYDATGIKTNWPVAILLSRYSTYVCICMCKHAFMYEMYVCMYAYTYVCMNVCKCE